MQTTSREQKALEAGVLTGRIRAIQAAHPKGHEALTNWGLWSLDRADIYPRLKPPSLWNQFKRDENDAYGEIDGATATATTEAPMPAKAEGPEKQPYNELQALAIDARIHGYGGLPSEIRYSLKAAYVSHETPEHQFPRHAGCGEDSFCERLEAALFFVERFL